MKKPFEGLYIQLEKSLAALGREQEGLERYGRGIVMIRERIGEMRVLGRKFVTGRETEVEFFRRVWPVFYGKLLLYIRLYRFEAYRVSLPVEQVPALIAREERRVAGFFRKNREFWMYFRSGTVVLDEQFTRAYSQSRLFDPLALVIDPEGATLASYRAACGLAMEGYMVWLAEEKGRLLQPEGLGDYTWDPTDADFVEWLYGLLSVGAIRYKGGAADVSRLQKWAKLALGKEVANIYDRFKVVRNRKKERMAFTRRTASALERRMDQAEGRFE